MMSAVDDYLSKVPEAQRLKLEKLRKLILDSEPGVEEMIAYKMPAYKYKGRPLVYFAAFKDHVSVFPTAGPLADLDKKLQEYKTGKGTLQFPNEVEIPGDAIRELIAERKKQIEAA